MMIHDLPPPCYPQAVFFFFFWRGWREEGGRVFRKKIAKPHTLVDVKKNKNNISYSTKLQGNLINKQRKKHIQMYIFETQVNGQGRIDGIGRDVVDMRG